MDDLALAQISESGTIFDGFVEVNSKIFRLHMERKGVETRVSCDWKLHYMLRKHSCFLKQRLPKCASIDQFIDELKTILKHNMMPHTSIQEVCYDTVLNHIQALGWNHVHEISDDFSKLSLEVEDSSKRQHIMLLEFTPKYPAVPPRISCTLPHAFNLLWTQTSDLKNVCKQFTSALQQYQRFWDDVEELKCHAWILEPEYPNYAATTFRLALGNGCSMQVKIDPLYPEKLPACCFLGAEWAIHPFQENFQNKFEDWNEALSVVQNLKNLLEIDFPKRDSSNSQDVSLQCGICYAYRLGTDIPDQICSQRNCSQSYHHQCLLEWIRSVPTTKRSFDTLFGECPYCTAQMKISLLHS